MNTLKQFLEFTKFERGTNHPTASTLSAKFVELGINDDLQIDIMTFFLYDNESELNEAMEQINSNLFNSIEYGEEIQLTTKYHLYKYCEDEFYTIVETENCEELLAVLINNDLETFTFEQL